MDNKATFKFLLPFLVMILKQLFKKTDVKTARLSFYSSVFFPSYPWVTRFIPEWSWVGQQSCQRIASSFCILSFFRFQAPPSLICPFIPVLPLNHRSLSARRPPVQLILQNILSPFPKIMLAIYYGPFLPCNQDALNLVFKMRDKIPFFVELFLNAQIFK